jgi:hypothetical protein
MFMLFEIWTEDEDGHQELIETTASETAAKKLAEKLVLDGAYTAIVLQETEDGDLEEVFRVETD